MDYKLAAMILGAFVAGALSMFMLGLGMAAKLGDERMDAALKSKDAE
jgi:hypothetical protein